MKIQFALILILWSSISLTSIGVAQNSQDAKVYEWAEVQNANPDTIYAISFDKLKITEVPVDLFRFHNVRHLSFAKNKLTELPAFISTFQALEHLDLTKNEFSNFPVVICQLKNLKNLLIGKNDIASLPDCIEYASSLEYLDLYDNPLSNVPESMMRLEKLVKIDFTGIRYNRDFQEKWKAQLPNTKLIFDPPCNCMD